MKNLEKLLLILVFFILQDVNPVYSQNYLIPFPYHHQGQINSVIDKNLIQELNIKEIKVEANFNFDDIFWFYKHEGGMEKKIVKFIYDSSGNLTNYISRRTREFNEPYRRDTINDVNDSYFYKDDKLVLIKIDDNDALFMFNKFEYDSSGNRIKRLISFIVAPGIDLSQPDRDTTEFYYYYDNADRVSCIKTVGFYYPLGSDRDYKIDKKVELNVFYYSYDSNNNKLNISSNQKYMDSLAKKNGNHTFMIRFLKFTWIVFIM